MTLYHGPKTTVEIDRKSGRVRVWDAKSGKLMYELYIRTEQQCAS